MIQITACLLVFFVCNQLESQFMSTGAFEVTLNGTLCCYVDKLCLSLWQVMLRMIRDQLECLW